MKLDALPEVIRNYEKLYGKLNAIVLEFKDADVRLFEEENTLHIEVML